MASWLLIAMVAGICVLLSHIEEQNPKRWDHTETGMHSLTDQGKAVVKKLPEDASIKIIGFYVSLGDRFQESQREAFRSLTDAAKAARPAIEVETVDPETSPARAARSGVTSNGTVIVTWTPPPSQGEPSRSETLQNPDEADLVNALLRLSSGERPAVYAVTGHGEASLSGSGADGISILSKRLSNKTNFS